jgi:hypothetical protein
LLACQHCPKGVPEQPDISRSGRDFLGVCSSIDIEGNRGPARIYAIRVWQDESEEKRDFSLRRPMLSQERKWKKKIGLLRSK